MDINKLFKGMDLHSDFVAVSYTEWKNDEVRKKPYRLVSRLKKIGRLRKGRTERIYIIS